jgi:hypothetical protein
MTTNQSLETSSQRTLAVGGIAVGSARTPRLRWVQARESPIGNRIVSAKCPT